MIIAKITNKEPRFLHITLGDSHIYSAHIEQVNEQLNRIPFKFPTLDIQNIKNLEDIDTLVSTDFILSNYKYHPTIKASMIA